MHSRNTNTIGNITKDNDKRNALVYKKYISRFILRKRPTVCYYLRDRWRDYIYSEKRLIFPYLLPGARGYQRLASSSETNWSASCPMFDCYSLHSKSDDVVFITWSPSGYIPVRPECPEALSSSCALIKMWQVTKTHGVTRHEPKIHVICYITTLVELDETYYERVRIRLLLGYVKGSSLMSLSLLLQQCPACES